MSEWRARNQGRRDAELAVWWLVWDVWQSEPPELGGCKAHFTGWSAPWVEIGATIKFLYTNPPRLRGARCSGTKPPQLDHGHALAPQSRNRSKEGEGRALALLIFVRRFSKFRSN